MQEDFYFQINNSSLQKFGLLALIIFIILFISTVSFCWVLVGKPEGKRPLGRPRRRWEDSIKMDLQEVGGGCGD
jgi:hypothetical protein